VKEKGSSMYDVPPVF